MKIELRDLGKSYGGKKVLSEVSFEILPGQIVALLGVNGAGKSTLLQLLGGVLVPTRGEILFDGDPFRRKRIDQRKRLHFLPDFPCFFAGTTVLKHLAMMLDLYGKDSPDTRVRVTDLLEKLDLLPLIHADLGTLSRGQIYKVALLGVSAVEPELWLLDEPFASGMDPAGLRVMREEVARAAGRGATVVFSSQILAAAEQLATDVLVLDDARLKVLAPLAGLRDAAGNDADLESLFNQLTQ